jgi:hypothetical protein
MVDNGTGAYACTSNERCDARRVLVRDGGGPHVGVTEENAQKQAPKRVQSAVVDGALNLPAPIAFAGHEMTAIL